MVAVTETSPSTRSVVVKDAHDWKKHAMLLIAEPLQSVEKLLSETLQSNDSSLDDVLRYLRGQNGKRLRPSLTLLSSLASGNRISAESIRLAAVVELVHLATLVHDDILDESDLRHFRATVHKKWNKKTAILSGDWLFTRAYGLANQGESTLPGRWIADAACRICGAELVQDQAVNHWNLSEEDYLAILAGKTGELCAVSSRLGAWTSTPHEKVWDSMGLFGKDLGIAFQIHDDWLDYWGSSASTGKPAHGDLLSGKQTLPLIYLFSKVSEPIHRELLQLLQQDRSQVIPMIHEHLERVDAELYIRRKGIQFAERAKAHLASVPPSAARDALASLAELAVSRFV